MNTWAYTLLSVLLVSLLSFIGIITLVFKAKTLKHILLYLVSFSAGALFGDAFLHLLPESVEKLGFGVSVSLLILSGIVFSLLIEKFIHWRHCHIPPSKEHVHPFAMMNLLGDATHNFIDGILIAASYLASIPLGIATTLAVVLHEIPQELGDFGVLLHGGLSRKKALFMNFLTALSAVLGAVLTLSLSSHIQNLALYLVPFAAGEFIYIAGSDLIPELHKEVAVKKSVLQVGMFILGIVIMALLLVLKI